MGSGSAARAGIQRALAEGSDIYTLALGWETSVDPVSTWDPGFPYGSTRGVAAMKAGLADHYFQYLIIDGYYTKALRSELQQVAQAASYRQVCAHGDALSGGATVLTQVYALNTGQPLGADRKHAPCSVNYVLRATPRLSAGRSVPEERPAGTTLAGRRNRTSRRSTFVRGSTAVGNPPAVIYYSYRLGRRRPF